MLFNFFKNLCMIFHNLDKLLNGGVLMGIKNMFKKSSKIFDKEGFYIILFICLCVVAVTAVYMSRNNANMVRKNAEAQKQMEQQKQQPESTGPQLVDEKTDTAAPTMQQPDKTASSAKTNTTAKSTSSKGSAPQKTVSSSVSLKLEMPVVGEVSKKFDKENLQFSSTMQQWETHEGLDIACDAGTEVKASADGKVVDVVNDETIEPSLNIKTGYGVSVIIDHGNGLRTMYCNLDQNVKVKKGDTVKKGQVIGVVGDTAVREAVSIEGSHLHFVVLKKSGKEYVTMDPQDFLK